jgi:ankyrin repeat protein
VPLAGFLLDHGSDPDHCLWAAVNRDDPDAIRLLVERGAPDPTDADSSPLLAAVQWNRYRAAAALLELGADPDHQDRRGRTALHWVLDRRRDARWVALLLEHGARTDLADGEERTSAAMMKRKRDPAIRRMALALK